jgi:hypothetical protein
MKFIRKTHKNLPLSYTRKAAATTADIKQEREGDGYGVKKVKET